MHAIYQCEFTVWVKIKMSPIILVALRAHHTPSLTSSNGSLQMDRGIPTDQYPLRWELTYPPRWNTSVESNPAVYTLWRYQSTKLIYYINSIKHMYCTETYNPARGHLCWLTMHKDPEKLFPIKHMKVDHWVGLILYNTGANNWLDICQIKQGLCMCMHAWIQTLFTIQCPILNKL